MAFRKSSNQMIKKYWNEYLNMFLKGKQIAPTPPKTYNQLALSMAVARVFKEDEVYHMTNKDHAMKWLRESRVPTTVWHYGGRSGRDVK
jgi:hypothetical protein